MKTRSIAFFAMDEFGHFLGLLPVVAGMTELGVPAYVFTHRRYRDRVESVGARFVDLFADRPLEAADDTSMPVPCRYVSFAGRYGAELLPLLDRLRPAAIVYDTFAVIGPVLGRALGVPYVNVCGGHNIRPTDYLEYLANDPRVSISEKCHQAVEVLKSKLGFPEASPFSYVTALSPSLNLYCEPPGFLSDSDPFHPIAFFGTLPTSAQIKALDRRPIGSYFPGDDSLVKMYVSFGTVVGRYYRPEVLAAWEAIARHASRHPRLHVVISLAGIEIDPDERRALQKSNVDVHAFVDQWAILREARLFVTHQGLHSTHEAMFHQVPMLSYPFFWDQPSLARTCAELGAALPLSDRPRDPIDPGRLQASVAECLDRFASMKVSLAKVREWELETLAGRGSVLRQILDLCG